MSEIFPGITWAALQYFPVGIIIALALLVLMQRVKRVKKVLQVLQPKGSTLQLIGGAALWRSVVRAVLLLMGMFFLWLALLRPQWDQKEEIVQQEGRDLLIALDVSRSMLASDVAPNRLELTKQKIRSLVNRLSSDRVGLLLFSGDAVVQCPLTNDFNAFFMFLDQVSVETISSGTTALDLALKKAIALFKQGASRQNKLLVLFTDGEDFSTNLSGIRRTLAQDKIILFTMGVGTLEGSPIPLFDSNGKQAGHQKNRHGAVVISRLNESLLQELARETGGIYVHVDASGDADVESLSAQVHRFEKEKFDDKKMSHLQDQYPYFLMVTFFCFALEWLL